MVLWDINKEGLTSIKKEIESQGNQVETMICDLRDREEINSCAIEVLKPVLLTFWLIMLG